MTTIDDLRPLFDAILAAPDDDAPRLAFAEALAVRGDPRAERVRLECELERLELDDPERAELEARSKPLPIFHFFTHGYQPRVWGTWRRGFIETVWCNVRTFVGEAHRLFQEAPITIAEPKYESADDVALLAQCPAIARLRGLRLEGFGNHDERARLLGSPYLATSLRELTMWHAIEHASDADRLEALLHDLEGLRVLKLRGHIRAPEPLAEIAHAHDLEMLHVFGPIADCDLEVLRDKLGEDRVWPRREPPYKFRFGVLDLSRGLLTTAQVRTLIDSGECRDATRLILSGSRVGDEGFVHYARSGAFPDLLRLDAALDITDDGVRVLAREAVGLDTLESIFLGEHPESDEAYGGGISDAVVEELARSPRLSSLRRISRTRTWRMRFDGRDDDEVIPIQREDGKVVSSIIGHVISP